MTETVAVSDATTAFFEELARREHEPVLAKARGTVRIELTNGTSIEPWLVTIDHGELSVLHGTGHADCTLRADGALFGQIVTGEVNAVAAALRGAIVIEGDWHLLLLFQRLFPGPPRAAASARSGAGAPTR